MTDNHYLDNLSALIRDYVKDHEVKIYLFGSRAKGTAHRLSDVDIGLLASKPLPISFIANLKEKIEESTIPYSVDIIDLSTVDEAFQKKVLAEGIEWKD